MKTQLSKPARDKPSTAKSTRRRRWSYGVTVDAARPRLRPNWVFEHRCSIAGPGPSAKPIIPHMSPSQGAAWKSSKRRSANCALRTQNF